MTSCSRLGNKAPVGFAHGGKWSRRHTDCVLCAATSPNYALRRAVHTCLLQIWPTLASHVVFAHTGLPHASHPVLTPPQHEFALCPHGLECTGAHPPDVSAKYCGNILDCTRPKVWRGRDLNMVMPTKKVFHSCVPSSTAGGEKSCEGATT